MECKPHGDASRNEPSGGAAYAALLEHGLDGAYEALRIIVSKAAKIERSEFLGARPYERTETRCDYANGFKPKTMLARLGEVTFEVPPVRSGDFSPSIMEKGTRGDRAVHLARAEMYMSSRIDQTFPKAGLQTRRIPAMKGALSRDAPTLTPPHRSARLSYEVAKSTGGAWCRSRYAWHSCLVCLLSRTRVESRRTVFAMTGHSPHESSLLDSNPATHAVFAAAPDPGGDTVYCINLAQESQQRGNPWPRARPAH